MGGRATAAATLILRDRREGGRIIPSAIPWVTLMAVGLGLGASAVGDQSHLLQYDREAVLRGEIWRPVTGQLVHWTGRMTLADFGAMLILGGWLEGRSRRLALACLAGGVLLIGGAIHFLMPAVVIYRGASGLDSALFVAAAFDLWRRSGGRGTRWVVASALAIFIGKLCFEAATGVALAAGPLPDGVAVSPQVHLAGAAAGFLAWLGLGEKGAAPGLAAS